MVLQTIWFFLWGLLWAMYFMTDGFDLGIGTLYPILGKTNEDKQTMINAMGPLWDGNEVWLLTAGGVTFAAFPLVYSVMFSSLYTALMLILFALIIFHLPKYRQILSRAQRVRNTIVAVAGGCLMTVLLLVALSVQQGSRLAGFFKEHSLISAHGRNIVNVIIVDFRGMDTMGEITVLAIAGAGVYTLLKLRLQGKNE